MSKYFITVLSFIFFFSLPVLAKNENIENLSDNFHFVKTVTIGGNHVIKIFQHKKSKNCYAQYGKWDGGFSSVTCADFNILTNKKINIEPWIEVPENSELSDFKLIETVKLVKKDILVYQHKKLKTCYIGEDTNLDNFIQITCKEFLTNIE